MMVLKMQLILNTIFIKSSFINAIELNSKNYKAYINFQIYIVLQNEFNKSITIINKLFKK